MMAELLADRIRGEAPLPPEAKGSSPVMGMFHRLVWLNMLKVATLHREINYDWLKHELGIPMKNPNHALYMYIYISITNIPLIFR